MARSLAAASGSRLSGQDAGRGQAGPPPAPAGGLEVPAHGGGRERQPEARGQEGGQQRDRPAGLHQPGAARRLAGLRVDDLARQPLAGRAATARQVVQAGDAGGRVAVQPGPDHVVAAGVDGGDLRHAVPAIREQHHLRAQGDPADRLPAHRLQLGALLACQMHVQHRRHLLPVSHARCVPDFWSCA